MAPPYYPSIVTWNERPFANHPITQNGMVLGSVFQKPYLPKRGSLASRAERTVRPHCPETWFEVTWAPPFICRAGSGFCLSGSGRDRRPGLGSFQTAVGVSVRGAVDGALRAACVGSRHGRHRVGEPAAGAAGPRRGDAKLCGRPKFYARQSRVSAPCGPCASAASAASFLFLFAARSALLRIDGAARRGREKEVLLFVFSSEKCLVRPNNVFSPLPVLQVRCRAVLSAMLVGGGRADATDRVGCG